MIGLVGLTGYAGSGKSTAVKHLLSLTNGQKIYLGQTVTDEVNARELPQTPESERQVRIDLRREKGPEALALPYVDLVMECVEKRIPVFVDAIFTPGEFAVLASRVPSGFARRLRIDASFDIRAARLVSRPVRPLTADELRKRDETESKELGTAAVMAAAEYKIRNEETLDKFYRRLAEFVSCCT